ncbi:MAG: asparagine synthase (glutamine-hydrolyzing) [Steroidobacteraceae bacterium]
MCGICGFWSRSEKLSESVLRRMNEQIRRRGPDGEGFYFDGGVGLAMRRLAIIDLAGGDQPIYNEDRTIAIVFNGEIYNYKALREHLREKGHRLATNSDTEAIVHLYEEYGLDAPKHLEGMFAFALWDSRKRRLVLARDRLGIKPLFVAETRDGVVFGSEIKSLLASGVVSRDIDWQALDQYLAYTFIPQPRSIYAGIRKIPPASVVTIESDGAVRVQPYWEVPDTSMSAPAMSTPDWVESCEAALKEAVSSHLVSDVPVGAFLSGGLDSGVMVAMMAKAMDRPVQTFTVGFTAAGRSFIDERKYARMLAQQYKLEHREIEIEPHAADILGEVVDAFDEPFADDSVVPSYYVSQAAAANVKVALTGLGGDELFAGYRRHLGLVLGDRYALLPRWLRDSVIRPVIERLPESSQSSDVIDHLKRFARGASLSGAHRYQDSMLALADAERRSLFAPQVRQQLDTNKTTAVMVGPYTAGQHGGNLTRALRTDLNVYLVDDILTLTDRLSMWHSLELRVPYLDHRFVELMQRAPEELKIRGTSQKYLLKKIAERWLPHEMIYHRKQGFEAPMGQWLRGPLLPLFDEVVNESSVARLGWFDFGVIKRLREEHVTLKRKNSKVLFSLLMLMLWARRQAAV